MKLIVFSGLPGVGKTTLAKLLAADMHATYLRIDTIEQALRRGTPPISEVSDFGYQAGFALAEENLQVGQDVVADAVNPISQARQAWQKIAQKTQSAFSLIEIVCTNTVEHQHRIETRTADLAGHQLPSWQDVLACHYEPWEQERMTMDTAGKSVSETYSELKYHLEMAASSPPKAE